jgi:hypothetical protein
LFFEYENIFMRSCKLAVLSLICFLIPAAIWAQKISGHVLNEGGKPASHIKVQFKDKSISTVTDADGSFTIVATKLPDTLLLSGPGYESYQVEVTGKTVSDTNFEVVMLSTRGKVELSDIVVSAISAETPGGEKRNSKKTPGNYITGKKLFLLDSTPANKGQVIYKAGLLTAGEVNDFNKWKLWEDFQENEFKTYADHWNIYPKKRFSVQVQNKDHIALTGQSVFLINKRTNDTVWAAITDNTGKAELWTDMQGSKVSDNYFIACKGADKVDQPSLFENGLNKITVNAPCSVSENVDIVFAVDATGSMGDEIDYLKIELEDVIRNTFAKYKDLNVRIGSVFYRDKGDEYITRYSGFQSDLVKVLNFIKLQRAAGGGDEPESVDVALQTALDTLRWSTEARSRMLFLILDAPPHDETKEKIFRLIKEYSSKGIRIIPVVCSGAEKSTEFIMRCMALATNGTYVFLANDSGAGFFHSKPTTDFFSVEFLNFLLERIITQMIAVGGCSGNDEAEIFHNIPPNIEHIKIYPNASQRNFVIESKNHLKDVFITDFTGKILLRPETNEKQNKWTVNLDTFPNATLLVKYITTDNQWGAEKFVLTH